MSPFLKEPSNFFAEEWVEAAEKAARKHPRSWVVHYMLADKCCDLGRFDQAASAARRCVELRPDDLRSTYALATVFNALSMAAYAGRTEAELARHTAVLLRESPVRPRGVLANLATHIDAALAGLHEMGIGLEEVSSSAIRWFERSLELASEEVDRQAIWMSLRSLYMRFIDVRPEQARRLWWEAFELHFCQGAQLMDSDPDGGLGDLEVAGWCLEHLGRAVPNTEEGLAYLSGALKAAECTIELARTAREYALTQRPEPPAYDRDVLLDRMARHFGEIQRLKDETMVEAEEAGRLFGLGKRSLGFTDGPVSGFDGSHSLPGGLRGLVTPVNGGYSASRTSFDEALEHYRQLPTLLGRPDERGDEIQNVIRLCRQAIRHSPTDGDAYVLLADALQMLSVHLEKLDQEGLSHHYMLLALAVIEHWRRESLAAVHANVGAKVLSEVRDHMRANGLSPSEYDQVMAEARRRYLDAALSGES